MSVQVPLSLKCARPCTSLCTHPLALLLCIEGGKRGVSVRRCGWSSTPVRVLVGDWWKPGLLRRTQRLAPSEGSPGCVLNPLLRVAACGCAQEVAEKHALDQKEKADEAPEHRTTERAVAGALMKGGAKVRQHLRGGGYGCNRCGGKVGGRLTPYTYP